MNKTRLLNLNVVFPTVAMTCVIMACVIMAISLSNDKSPIIENPPASLDIEPLFFLIDVNHDGYLDLQELSNAKGNILHLDKNLDFKVSLEETFFFPKTGGDGPTIP